MWVSRSPIFTLFWYGACISIVYLALLRMVGMDMALRYLGSGKGYANVLMSFRGLTQKPVDGKARIFFFGDSTIASLDDREAAPERLKEKLQEDYGKNSVEVIQWAFSGSSMFHYYCFTCKAKDYSPSLIIVPINYRTFGALWQGQTRDNKERKILNSELIAFAPLWERFDKNVASINEIEGFTIPERVSGKVKYWEVYYFRGIKMWAQDYFSRALFNTSPVLEQMDKKNREATEAMQNIQLSEARVQYSRTLFRDLFPKGISKDQVQFRSYAALADALRRREIPFLFYVTPLNIQQMKEYDAFDSLEFGKSISLFRDVAVANGGSFVDLSMLLKPGDFNQFEHYTPEAATVVAEALAPKVERILHSEAPR